MWALGGPRKALSFLTGAVIPRAHGPTPAPAPNPVFLAVGSLARVGALFSREFRALGGPPKRLKLRSGAQERRILASWTLLRFLGRSWEYAGEASRGYLALGIAVGSILN